MCVFTRKPVSPCLKWKPRENRRDKPTASPAQLAWWMIFSARVEMAIFGLLTEASHGTRAFEGHCGFQFSLLIWRWLSKPMGSHFGVGAPPILEPIFVGIGMFTGGYGILTHGHLFELVPLCCVGKWNWETKKLELENQNGTRPFFGPEEALPSDTHACCSLLPIGLVWPKPKWLQHIQYKCSEPPAPTTKPLVRSQGSLILWDASPSLPWICSKQTG